MKKQSWSGSAGFIFAAAGAAVGLGNIWSFPRYMTQAGGLLFLLLYMILAVFVGYPLLLGELALGRETGEKPRLAFKSICGSAVGGVLSELAALLMMGFYSVLGGCCIRYMLVNLGEIFKSSGKGGLSLFLAHISNVPVSALYTVIFIAVSALIIMSDVSKGLERFSKIAMPLLALMLPGLIFCALSLPGAGEGVRAMFSFPEEINAQVFLSSLGCAGVQMFFSLSIGVGCMITYGAYLPSGISIPKCAAAVVAADTMIALLAGLAVVPAAHAVGGEGQEGAMLMFVTMQNVFDGFGQWGSMFGFLFYLLLLLAALTSAVSLLEVITSMTGGESRRKSGALLAGALAAIPAIAIARDGMGFGALPEILGMSWLDAAELLCEAVLMPLSSIALVIALRSGRAEAMLRRQLGAKIGCCTALVIKLLAPPLIIAVMAIRLHSAFN